MIPKFRAWLKDAKEMVDVIEIDLYNEEIFYIYNDYENQEQIRLWAKFDDIELMQSTGLKDKNGVEIYEGDIVHDTWSAYTPIFRNGIYMAFNVDSLHLSEPEPSTQFNIIWKNGCEVTGNIYENPELVEELEE